MLDLDNVEEKLLDDEVVVLLQGDNVFGDPIYSYLQLTVRKLKELQQALKDGKNFAPSEFGSVIAAGKGEPDEELKAEMAVKHKMVTLPKPKAAHTAQPSFWAEDNEQDTLEFPEGLDLDEIANKFKE